VQSFGQSHGFSIADDYLAGLWRAHLPAALCWAAGSPTKRSTTYMAPSWSWASLEGDFILEVDDDLLQKQCFASIRRIWSNINVDSLPAELAMGHRIEMQGYVFELEVECDPAEASQCDFSVVLDPDLEGPLYWDEHLEGETVISHLDGAVIPLLTREECDQAARHTMAVKDAHGRFCYLLILDRGHKFHFHFLGLALYEPLEQPCCYYRVSYWIWTGLPRGISVNELSAQYKKETVLLPA
jgi:hypothetical protein